MDIRTDLVDHGADVVEPRLLDIHQGEIFGTVAGAGPVDQVEGKRRRRAACAETEHATTSAFEMVFTDNGLERAPVRYGIDRIAFQSVFMFRDARNFGAELGIGI